MSSLIKNYKKYICTEDGCNKVFTTSSHRARHFRSDHCEIRYNCDTCGNSYTRKDKLTKHIHNKHRYPLKPETSQANHKKTDLTEKDINELSEWIEQLIQQESVPDQPPNSPTQTESADNPSAELTIPPIPPKSTAPNPKSGVLHATAINVVEGKYNTKGRYYILK